MFYTKPKRKVLPDNETTDKEEQFIFYNQDKLHTVKFEFEIIIQLIPERKFFILIDSKSTLGFLNMKIVESINQFPEFSKLKGLRAVNLQKKTDKGLFSIENNQAIELKDCFENGNTIYCKILTDEYWIRTIINLKLNLNQTSISLDFKFSGNISINKFKYIILKAATDFLVECIESDYNHHFIFKCISCQTNKSKQNVCFQIDDFSKDYFYDELTLEEIFQYNSEITCDFDLISIEELIFKEFIQNVDTKNIVEKQYIEELKLLDFEGFVSSKKYEKESKNFLKEVKYQIKKLQNQAKDLYLFYPCPEDVNSVEIDESLSDQNEFCQLIIRQEAQKWSNNQETAQCVTFDNLDSTEKIQEQDQKFKAELLTDTNIESKTTINLNLSDFESNTNKNRFNSIKSAPIRKVLSVGNFKKNLLDENLVFFLKTLNLKEIINFSKVKINKEKFLSEQGPEFRNAVNDEQKEDFQNRLSPLTIHERNERPRSLKLALIISIVIISALVLTGVLLFIL